VVEKLWELYSVKKEKVQKKKDLKRFEEDILEEPKWED
jgi:uncharacterized protein YjaG (DUF416 family)